MNVVDHQLRQILKSVTGDPEIPMTPVYETFLEALKDQVPKGNLNLPCDPDSLFLCPERIPIFQDLARPRKSSLLNQLFDRSAETGVVVDSIFTGVNALFLARLMSSQEELLHWIRCMAWNHVELTVRPIDEENNLVLSPVKAFVVAHR